MIESTGQDSRSPQNRGTTQTGSRTAVNWCPEEFPRAFPSSMNGVNYYNLASVPNQVPLFVPFNKRASEPRNESGRTSSVRGLPRTGFLMVEQQRRWAAEPHAPPPPPQQQDPSVATPTPARRCLGDGLDARASEGCKTVSRPPHAGPFCNLQY